MSVPMPFHKVAHNRSNGLGKHLGVVQHRDATQMLQSEGRNSKDAVQQEWFQRIIAPGAN